MAKEYEVDVEQLDEVLAAFEGIDTVAEPLAQGAFPEGFLELCLRGVFTGVKEGAKTADGVEYRRAYVGLKWEIVGGPAAGDQYIGATNSEFFNLNHPDPEKQEQSLSFFKKRLRTLGIQQNGREAYNALQELSTEAPIFKAQAKTPDDSERQRLYINARL